MAQWNATLAGEVPDGDDTDERVRSVLDRLARLVAGDGADIGSASFESESTGPVNLHNYAASDATHEPTPVPAETGPAAAGVGLGDQHPGPAGAQDGATGPQDDPGRA